MNTDTLVYLLIFKNMSYYFWMIKWMKNAQKQSPRGVSRKRCSENMQQIYRRTPMPKCDHTSAWV